MAHENVILGNSEVLIEQHLKRTARGLLMEVKAHPMVEEIFQAWSIDKSMETASAHGRYWMPADEGDELQVWRMNQIIPITPLGQGYQYRVDRLGTLLIEGNDLERQNPGGDLNPHPAMSGISTVNISYLRLVGISGEKGKRFIVRGVFSLDGLKEINSMTTAAIRRIFMDYMRPVELNVVMSTRPEAL